MRKPAFCICENKDADQLRGNCAADQRLCFRYTDSTIPLLSKSKISSLTPSSVTAQPGLCGTWWETPKTGFLITRLIYTIPLVCRRHSVQITWRQWSVFPHCSLDGLTLSTSYTTSAPEETQPSTRKDEYFIVTFG